LLLAQQDGSEMRLLLSEVQSGTARLLGIVQPRLRCPRTLALVLLQSLLVLNGTTREWVESGRPFRRLIDIGSVEIQQPWLH
jgi:hypothetical protein